MDIKKLSMAVLRDLYGGSRRLSMYPLGHPVTHETLNNPLNILNQFFKIKHSYTIEMVNNRLIVEGILLDEAVFVSGLAHDMKKQKLTNIVIYSGVQMGDLYHFLTILVARPGPFEDHVSRVLKSNNIEKIRVNAETPRNIFDFQGFDIKIDDSKISINDRIVELIMINRQSISSYYLGRIRNDNDLLKELKVDIKLRYAAPLFKKALTDLDSKYAAQMLEDIVYSTNWLGDDDSSETIKGLKKLFGDYFSRCEDNDILSSVYKLFKKVGTPDIFVEQLFDNSKVIKFHAFKDSEKIVEALSVPENSRIDAEVLRNTVSKLATAGQSDYLNELIDQLLKSITGQTLARRQQGLDLASVAADVLAKGNYTNEFGKLCRDAVALALLPDKSYETVELLSQLGWHALKYEYWNELKHIARTLRGIVSDKTQQPKKRELASSRLDEISQSSQLTGIVNDLLGENWSYEAGNFFEAFSNLGSKEITRMLAGRITDPDINIRSRVVKLLVGMKKDSAEVLSQMLADEVERYNGEEIDDEKWYLVRNILRVIKEVKAVEALPYLEIMTSWPNKKVKLEIIKTLDGMPFEFTMKLLSILVEDEIFEVKKAAVISMGLTGNPDMMNKLIDIFQNIPDCRILAVAAFGRIGGGTARDMLIDILESDSISFDLDISDRQYEDIKVAALKALAKIGDDVSISKLKEYSRTKIHKSLFRKDILSNTAKIVLGVKSRT